MTTAPVFARILRYGALLALGVAVIGSVAGWFVAAERGVVSALIGAAIAFVFLGITAASILLAGRVAKWDLLHPAFFSIIFGGWLIKFIAFLIVLIVLKDQPWIDRTVLLLCVIAAVIGSLVVDMIVIAKARVPLVELPEVESDAE